jgi:hypothetical protein
MTPVMSRVMRPVVMGEKTLSRLGDFNGIVVECG